MFATEVDTMDLHTKLKEIVESIEDITDPEGMEKLLQYFDEITKEDNEFMEVKLLQSLIL